MYAAVNILVCDMDKTYTVLNRYDPKSHLFEGEYSLLHNAYSQDAYFLSRFLMEHRGHSLIMLDSESERYYHIKTTYKHYGEEDIERYMAELAHRRHEEERNLEMKQNMGQLQLRVAKKMIEQEWESVQQKESNCEKDTYVLLGQDFAFRRSLQTINQVVNFGQE